MKNILYFVLLTLGFFRLGFEFLNSGITGDLNNRALLVAMCFFLGAIACRSRS